MKATKSVLDGASHRSEKASPSIFANHLQQAGASSDATAKLIQALDTDRNGTLSLNEVKAAERIFSQIDTDANGQITQAELTQFLARPSNAVRSGQGI
jgi:Ca2+-binding EF-hand superfamily protein